MYVREKMQRLNNIHVYLGQGLHCSQVTCYACFSVVCYFLFKTTLNFSEIPLKCQTVWIQIKPDILSCLIWVQLICKGYQRPTLVSDNCKNFMSRSKYDDGFQKIDHLRKPRVLTPGTKWS